MIGAKVAVDPNGSMAASTALDFVARNEFDYTIKEGADGSSDWSKITGPATYRNECRRHRAHRGTRDPRGHGCTALRHRGLQARPTNRGLLHRLSEASLHIALYRQGLPLEMHLLPVAADGRRASLPHAQRRERHRRDALRQGSLPAGAGISSSTTTPSPTTCRAPKRSRASLGKLGITWSCNAKANVPRETLKTTCQR